MEMHVHDMIEDTLLLRTDRSRARRDHDLEETAWSRESEK